MLLTRNTPEHDPYRLSFRKYANEHAKYQQRVQYTYVHADTQTQFVNKLTQGKGVENDTSLKVRYKVVSVKSNFVLFARHFFENL